MFLKNKFSEYYNKLWIEKYIPEDITRREFGFSLFEENVMVRHISFHNEKEYFSYLKRKVPRNAYYSSAYYEFPDAKSMQEKIWIGAELVFDIDADHIPTDCKDSHDSWICQNCGFSSKGVAPNICPKCGSTKINVKAWFCEKCLEAAKNETFKLIDDFLIPDFGFSYNDLTITFSGHRGYHIHVDTEVIREIDQNARREIVNYLMGQGVDPKLQGIVHTKGKIILPLLNEPAWRGKSIKALINFLKNLNNEQIEKLKKDIGFEKVEALTTNREIIIKKLQEGVIPTSILKFETFNKILKFAIEEFSCKIDSVVTADIKRLMRLPSSLHGKTGLKVSIINYIDLEKFDPLKDSVVFKKGHHIIKIIEKTPEIILNGELFGSFNPGDITEVPDSVAVLLVGKNYAEIY